MKEFNFTTTDSLNADGLTTATQSELLQIIQDGIQQLYSPTGDEIDFSSSSPDGQFTNILATMGAIVRELITQVYNSTDPSKCEGVQQDSKYQLNFIYRNGGTYTIQNIDVTAIKTVSLQGLDSSYNTNTSSAFTVSDDNGNLWYLIDSVTVQPGITSLPFRAKEIGEVTPIAGTITNIVTVTDGITGVINDMSYTSLGEEQESDGHFRTRREQSVAKQSGNAFDSIISQIMELDGVIDATGENNVENEASKQGTPAHTIWVIVNGGANDEIANVIYSNMAGSGTRGEVVIPINSVSAQTLDIKFDRPIPVSFFLRFDLQPFYDELTLNKQLIQDYIAENLTYLLGESIDIVKSTQVIADALASLGNIGYPAKVEVSLGGQSTIEYTPGDVTEATAGTSTITVEEGQITSLKTVSNGCLTISVDGTDHKITELDFQSVENIVSVVNVISPKLTTLGCTVEMSAVNKITFKSKKTGVGSSIELKTTAEPNDATDVYEASYLNGGGQERTEGADEVINNKLENVQINSTIFQQAVGDVESQSFEFTYEGGWMYAGQTIEIADYGISYTGEEHTNDKFTVSYTQGEWSTFLENPSLQQLFVISAKNVFINELE